MYVPPHLRNTSSDFITNVCDEFLHIDDTPEASISKCCVCQNCIRKSVTCIAQLTEDGNEVYSNVYKNKQSNVTSAIHAEIFMIHDTKLRNSLRNNQSLTLYLTFQPCHFSGGHYKKNQISCTESIIHFYEKVLSPLNINLVIKFSYIYRAHWIYVNPKYSDMIYNAMEGLLLLRQCAKLDVIEESDLHIIYKFCDDSEKKKWDKGLFNELIFQRKELNVFMKQFITDLGID